MGYRFTAALVLGSVLFSARGLSQEVFDDAVIQPLAAVRTPTLADLVQAKLDPHDGAPRLILMVEAFRTEKRMVKRTMMRIENRKRMVDDEQGQPVEKEFQVAVPLTEEVEVDTKIPAGRKPVEVAASEVTFYNVHAKKVELAEVAKQLDSLQPIFLIDGAEGELVPLPDLWKQVLRGDCLIAVTSKQVREQRGAIDLVPLAPAAAFPRPLQLVAPIPAVP